MCWSSSLSWSPSLRHSAGSTLCCINSNFHLEHAKSAYFTESSRYVYVLAALTRTNRRHYFELPSFPGVIPMTKSNGNELEISHNMRSELAVTKLVKTVREVDKASEVSA